MRDQELRSAFDIPGFLEGKVEITRWKDGERLKVVGGVIKSMRSPGEYSYSFLSANKLIEARWTPAPEHESKMYIHEYWNKHGVYVKKKTSLPWGHLFDVSNDVAEDISTIEIQE